ncbi:unnamed protein product [Linum trigynum]|uniref:BED-type domain-containing protein n=1 Tax=Linum trigynum TaxID=586398 RepID=A0AAV2F5L3_9ROSI
MASQGNEASQGNKAPQTEQASKDVGIGSEESDKATSASRKRKAPAFRSPHWAGYSVLLVKEGNPPVEVRKAKCNRCAITIVVGSTHGTNGLKNHKISCDKKHLEQLKQTTLSLQPSASGDGAGGISTWRFNQEESRLAFA